MRYETPANEGEGVVIDQGPAPEGGSVVAQAGGKAGGAESEEGARFHLPWSAGLTP